MLPRLYVIRADKRLLTLSADTFPQYELLRPRLQNADEGSNKYSTPNSGWAALGSFQKGQVLEMDLIMTANHMVRLLQTGVFQAYGLFFMMVTTCGLRTYIAVQQQWKNKEKVPA